MLATRALLVTAVVCLVALVAAELTEEEEAAIAELCQQLPHLCEEPAAEEASATEEKGGPKNCVL